MTSQMTPLFAMSDGTVVDEDDAVRIYLDQINNLLDKTGTVCTKGDIWQETAFFFDTNKQLALRLQKEVALLAHLQGRKLACEAKLKLKLKSCDYITYFKMKRCVEQANLHMLSRTSTSPYPLNDTGFYIKTKADGTTPWPSLYIAINYFSEG